MPEHDARGLRAVYDHEDDQPRRRRRPVHDWGVGEEIFDHMPRRRFARDERPRRGAHDAPPAADEVRYDELEAPYDEVAARYEELVAAEDDAADDDDAPLVTSPDGRRTVVIA